MQTMEALMRIAGSPLMTVKLTDITPAEAWLLMHIHDADTKDIFEKAILGDEVQRGKVEERDRLLGKYLEQKSLIDHLFPGRNASDVPDRFDELEGVPLELATEGKRQQRQQQAQEEVKDATEDAIPKFVGEPPRKLSDEDAKVEFVGKRK